ncbi:MAG: hypothetical protein MZV70_77650 [Desulfobacterales bacterium]|nr:hypothetical protein [Desulfobacterales bacterium]
MTNSTDATGQKTGYQYYPGRRRRTPGSFERQTAPSGRKRSCYDYTARGEPQHVWGDVHLTRRNRVYNGCGR